MFPKATKRKFSDTVDEMVDEHMVELRMASLYSLQRQSLLDMSLIKLQLCHMVVEPNLCRSVLIANTVRQIQEEMTQDGGWQIMAEAFHGSQAPADCLEATKILFHQTTPEQESTMSYQEVGYNADEVVVNPIASNASSAYVSASMEQSWQKEHLRDTCVEELSANKGILMEYGEEKETAEAVFEITEQVLGTFEVKNQALCPDPVLDELFPDIDSSYYDLDTIMTGIQGMPKTGPYDLLESLSSHGPSPIGSSCRPDLNELDHIMEIIVGS